MSRHIIDQYPKGKKFRVVKEGGSLFGWTPGNFTGSFSGWRRELHIGDVIESDGYGPGMGSDPGYGIHFKGVAADVQFRPSQGGPFSYAPADGYLEPVEGESE